MKKIVHLVSTDIFSGAENVACQIIKLFQNNNYNMYYVCTLGSNKKSLEERNINYVQIKKFNFRNINKVLKTIKPDIIHAHDIKASLYAALCCQKSAKIISHVHGNHENMRKVNLKTVLYNFSRSKYYRMIWVSKSALDDYVFKNKILEKSVILYNVINKEEIYKKIEDDINCYQHYDLIYLGRLTYPKNPLRLLDIIEKLKMNNESIKVAIVGDGDLKDEFVRKIRNLNLEKNVNMFGFTTNPYKILNSSDLMIMTSIYEGTPMCALEAMSLGKPIISTPTDGLKDIIVNNVNGFLSADNEELVKYILNLKINKKLMEDIKITTMKKFDEINDVEKYKKEISDIYEN